MFVVCLSVSMVSHICACLLQFPDLFSIPFCVSFSFTFFLSLFFFVFCNCYCNPFFLVTTSVTNPVNVHLVPISEGALCSRRCGVWGSLPPASRESFPR